MITRTDFIGVPSQDVGRSLAFFRDVLGLRPDAHGEGPRVRQQPAVDRPVEHVEQSLEVGIRRSSPRSLAVSRRSRHATVAGRMTCSRCARESVGTYCALRGHDRHGPPLGS